MNKKKTRRKKRIPEKIGPRTFKLFDPIFKQRIWVLLNADGEYFNEFLKKHNASDETSTDKWANFSAFATQMDSEDKPSEYIICMREFNWSIFNQGTLIHEIVHIVIRIFAANNIPFNKDTQEFIAQMVGRIYEDVAHKLLV